MISGRVHIMEYNQALDEQGIQQRQRAIDCIGRIDRLNNDRQPLDEHLDALGVQLPMRAVAFDAVEDAHVRQTSRAQGIDDREVQRRPIAPVLIADINPQDARLR